MKSAAQNTFAERVGRALGRVWRSCVRLDRKANGWLVAQGVAPGVVKAALLVVKLVAIGLLLYATLWLALLLALAVVAALVARNSEQDEPEEWAIGEQAEHKNNPGYDPILYNDMPDPRFDKD
jgi:hypothetical protein